MRFFSPDNIHINTKNFKSLIDYIRINKYPYIINTEHLELIKCFGNYEGCNEPNIMKIKEYLLDKGENDLFSLKENGINVFTVCKSEILCRTIKYIDPSDKLLDDNRILFHYLFSNHYQTLILNMSVGIFWISFWRSFFDKNKFDIALIFSGSLIYARTAIELLKHTPVRVFVLESFFTGNDFYLEERYSPIAGDPLIKYRGFYDQIEVEDTSDNYMKAINKYLMGKNLNVKQPEIQEKRPIFQEKRTVLVIGQVVNDFSLIENNLYSIDIYEKLIDKILSDTKYNIVFKAHPWEHKKANIGEPFTFNIIKQRYINNERVKCVDDYNLYYLFEQVQHVVVINSQSGIEGVWHGIRPIVLGPAFYGHKGFTYDCDEIDDAINYLLHNSQSIITLDEFNKFELFLKKVFLGYLVSKFPSGKIRIKEIFTPHRYIPLYKKPSQSKSIVSVNGANKPQSSTGTNKAINNPKPPVRVEIGRRERLLAKFKRSPKRYCLDSKFKILNFIGRMI